MENPKLLQSLLVIHLFRSMISPNFALFGAKMSMLHCKVLKMTVETILSRPKNLSIDRLFGLERIVSTVIFKTLQCNMDIFAPNNAKFGEIIERDKWITNSDWRTFLFSILSTRS